MMEPGCRRLALSPKLLGLEHAHSEFITPFGRVSVTQRAGQAPKRRVPDGIELELY